MKRRAQHFQNGKQTRTDRDGGIERRRYGMSARMTRFDATVVTAWRQRRWR